MHPHYSASRWFLAKTVKKLRSHLYSYILTLNHCNISAAKRRLLFDYVGLWVRGKTIFELLFKDKSCPSLFFGVIPKTKNGGHVKRPKKSTCL